jgi:hypothetical protein
MLANDQPSKIVGYSKMPICIAVVIFSAVPLVGAGYKREIDGSIHKETNQIGLYNRGQPDPN